jgi:hypothetical protein
MYERLEKLFEIVKPWPWVAILGPIALLYFLDLVQILLTVVQSLCAVYIFLSTVAFFAGVFGAVWDKLYGSNMRYLADFRYGTILPMLSWGFSLGEWLVEHPLDSEEEAD